MAGIGSLCERACVFLDTYLQLLMLKLKLYLHGSGHLIQQLEVSRIPTDALMITCDVKALYSNIVHKEGITATTHFLLQEYSQDNMFTSLLVDLLFLHPNFFVFEMVFYRQISGTVKGAYCAPSYTYLFLGWWEGTCMYPSKEFQQHVFGRYHFIDHISFFWQGLVESCKKCISRLNDNLWNIKLTHTTSQTMVDLLDLRLRV